MLEIIQGHPAEAVPVSAHGGSSRNLKGRGMILDPKPLCPCIQMVPSHTLGKQPDPDILRICEKHL